MGRFTELPRRLREASEHVSEFPQLDLGEWIVLSSLLRDAALKIEALERDALLTKPHNKDHADGS